MENKLLILAGNYQQACQFVKESNLKKGKFEYISEPEQLKGYQNFKYICVGTFYDWGSVKFRKKRRALELELKSRNAKQIYGISEFTKSPTALNQL